MTLALHRLNISCFRNHTAARLNPMGAKTVILTGANGAGKTNILEAVSLLSSGRGLRRAALDTLQNRDMPDAPWAVAADVQTPDGSILRMGTGPDREKRRRLIRIDGKDVKNRTALAETVSAVWLTPQMDRLFMDGKTARRRFLDRLVHTFDPAHAGRITRHDRHMRERLRLLRQTRAPDPAWLDALENNMAADTVAIAAARTDVAARLQNYTHSFKSGDSLFPAPLIHVAGWAEARIHRAPASALEDELQALLRLNRALDAHTGHTTLGAHRADMAVAYDAKNMPAAECSTGEQKSLLVAIILAHAMMMQGERGFVPLILLDEVAAHLDAARRAQLFARLDKIKAQVWLTGTDRQVFTGLGHDVCHYAVAQGHVCGDKDAQTAGTLS